MATGSVFGSAVTLPEGWVDETVYLFAGPPPARKGAARSTISVARLPARSLDDAVGRLGSSQMKADVLVDEIREDDGVLHYERVARFADPATGTPVQQSTRVYHRDDAAFVLVLTTAAIDFNDNYDGFARFAAGLSGKQS